MTKLEKKIRFVGAIIIIVVGIISVINVHLNSIEITF